MTNDNMSEPEKTLARLRAIRDNPQARDADANRAAETLLKYEPKTGSTQVRVALVSSAVLAKVSKELGREVVIPGASARDDAILAIFEQHAAEHEPKHETPDLEARILRASPDEDGDDGS